MKRVEKRNSEYADKTSQRNTMKKSISKRNTMKKESNKLAKKMRSYLLNWWRPPLKPSEFREEKQRDRDKDKI